MATDREREAALRRERTRQANRLPRLQRDTEREIARLLRRADREMGGAIARASSPEGAAYLKAARAEIRAALARWSEGAGEAAAKGQERAWALGVESVDAPLDAALGLEAARFRMASVLPRLDDAQLWSMRTFLVGKMRDVGIGFADRIQTQLGLAAMGAISTGDATGEIARLLKTGGRGRALTVVRTELGRAFSAAAQRRQEQAVRVVPGLRKEWRKSGARRERWNHAAIDGQVRRVDEPFDTGMATLMYPRDPSAPPSESVNCGCASLPWVEEWGEGPVTDPASATASATGTAGAVGPQAWREWRRAAVGRVLLSFHLRVAPARSRE